MRIISLQSSHLSRDLTNRSDVRRPARACTDFRNPEAPAGQVGPMSMSLCLYILWVSADTSTQQNFEFLRRAATSTIPAVSEDFYRATRMHSADYAVARCLSVTRRYSVEAAKHILKLCHHRVATPFWFFSRFPSNARRGYEKQRFSINISLYLGNDTTKANRKPYPSFRMVPFSMTFSSDPQP